MKNPSKLPLAQEGWGSVILLYFPLKSEKNHRDKQKKIIF